MGIYPRPTEPHSQPGLQPCQLWASLAESRRRSTGMSITIVLWNALGAVETLAVEFDGLEAYSLDENCLWKQPHTLATLEKGWLWGAATYDWLDLLDPGKK